MPSLNAHYHHTKTSNSTMKNRPPYFFINLLLTVLILSGCQPNSNTSTENTQTPTKSQSEADKLYNRIIDLVNNPDDFDYQHLIKFMFNHSNELSKYSKQKDKRFELLYSHLFYFTQFSRVYTNEAKPTEEGYYDYNYVKNYSDYANHSSLNKTLLTAIMLTTLEITLINMKKDINCQYREVYKPIINTIKEIFLKQPIDNLRLQIYIAKELIIKSYYNLQCYSTGYVEEGIEKAQKILIKVTPEEIKQKSIKEYGKEPYQLLFDLKFHDDKKRFYQIKQNINVKEKTSRKAIIDRATERHHNNHYFNTLFRKIIVNF